MRIEHVVVAGLREKTADSTNASFNGRAFLSCSLPVGGKAPYCSETRLSGKSRAVVFARGGTMRGEEFGERMSQTFTAQVQGGPSTVASK